LSPVDVVASGGFEDLVFTDVSVTSSTQSPTSPAAAAADVPNGQLVASAGTTQGPPTTCAPDDIDLQLQQV